MRAERSAEKLPSHKTATDLQPCLGRFNLSPPWLGGGWVFKELGIMLSEKPKSCGGLEVICLAKNTGNDYRIGSVKNRYQIYNPKIKMWCKVDATTGKIIDCSKNKFKGVAEYKDERRN